MTVQYLIDSICAKFTEKSLYELIEARLHDGPFAVDDILSSIQDKDRSLDAGSARMLAEAAIEDLEKLGEIKRQGDLVSHP